MGVSVGEPPREQEHGKSDLTVVRLTVLWVGKRRSLSPTPPTHLPMAGGRAAPEVIRARELSLPLTSCSTGGSGPYTCLDIRVDLALTVQVWESRP